MQMNYQNNSFCFFKLAESFSFFSFTLEEGFPCRLWGLKTSSHPTQTFLCACVCV